MIRLAAVALALTYFGLLLVGWWLNASVGFDGILRPPPHDTLDATASWVVLEVEPASPAALAGITAGDRVFDVDDSADSHQAYHNRRAGERGTLAVLDEAGRMRFVALTLQSRLSSPSLVLGMLAPSALGGALMVVGATVAWLRPDLLPARLLLVFAAGLATYTAADLWHWTQRVSRFGDAVDHITGSALLVGGVALLQLFRTLAGRPGASGRWKRLLWPGLYALALVPLGVWFVRSDIAWMIAVVLTMGLFLAVAVSLELHYRTASPVARAQLGWIRWAVSIGVAAIVLRTLLLVAVPEHIPAVVSDVLVPLAWLPFPIALAFSVLRYRLFDVDRVVRTTLTWGVLAGLIMLAYAVVVIAVSRLLASILGPTAGGDPIVAILAALAVAFAVNPMRGRLQAALDRHVYRRRRARDEAYALAINALGRLQTPPVVAGVLVHDVPTRLGIAHGWLAAPAETAPLLLGPDVTLASPSFVEAIQRTDTAAVLVSESQQAVYAGLPTLAATEPPLDTWHASGARLIVPLRAPEKRLLAIWALGEPRGGDLFEREDLGLLENIGVLATLQIEHLWKTGLEREPRQAHPGQLSPLSPREREVALLVAEGLTNSEIADRLVISERTAEGHVERIREKLGVRSRAQVAAWVAEQGYVRVDSGTQNT